MYLFRLIHVVYRHAFEEFSKFEETDVVCGGTFSELLL